MTKALMWVTRRKEVCYVKWTRQKDDAQVTGNKGTDVKVVSWEEKREERR